MVFITGFAAVNLDNLKAHFRTLSSLIGFKYPFSPIPLKASPSQDPISTP
ncbi:hypothetical protein HMPREF1565_3216 [Providencia alcalifaciens RIMD 1656011]|nr:hypothetical protein HMPREF1565_3216 [Providencia alcalifaciens RIMD 1656011]